MEKETAETEEDSVIMRGDNLSIVNLTKYNTVKKEAKYIQINHIVRKLTTNKRATQDHMKKAEFEFMMDLKPLIPKTAVDQELTRVGNIMRREDRETGSKSFQAVSENYQMWPHTFRRPNRHSLDADY